MMLNDDDFPIFCGYFYQNETIFIYYRKTLKIREFGACVLSFWGNALFFSLLKAESSPCVCA